MREQVVRDIAAEAVPTDDQAIIDQALQVIYSEHHRIASRLSPAGVAALPMEDLRRGPLGRDLTRLAQVARGQAQEPRERVLAAIESILQLLFWPAAADDYTVPRAFWDTGLGRLLALAKFRTFESSELVSIGDAARRLGVARPTIYRWIDDHSLDAVRDEVSGRTYVVRRDVEDRARVAEDLMAG